jgi:hypothetical protein
MVKEIGSLHREPIASYNLVVHRHHLVPHARTGSPPFSLKLPSLAYHLEGCGHEDSWPHAFQDEDLYEWLLEQRLEQR